MSPVRPPPIARVLLELLLPRAHREFVLGDLEEEFREIAARDGVSAGRRWYWRQALASLGRSRVGPTPNHVAKPAPGRLWDSVWQDVRFAARSFGRRPLFTAAAVLTLALGIGATAAVFGVADAVMFRPIPGVRDADRLGIVWFGRRSPSGGIRVGRVSYPNLDDLNAQVTRFERLAGYQQSGAHVAAATTDPEYLRVQFVTPSYFSVLGVQPVVGRTFTIEEDDPVQGGVPVAVISHRLWTRMFHGAPDVLDWTLQINGLPFGVIGVLPEGFHGTERLDGTDLWLPGTTNPYVSHFPPEFSNYADRDRGGYYEFVVRLAPGATWEEAEAELRRASARLAELHPGVNDKFTEVGPFVYPGIGVMPLAKSGTVSTLKLQFGIVGLILLIACANVANLLLLRGVTRRGERAVRTALGATRGRLVRQHLTENLLLWVSGGAVGVGVAWVLVRLFHGTQLMAVRIENVTVDWRVAGFALAAALATGLIFGTLPAVLGPRAELVATLKDAARTETGKRAYVRSGLTVLQMAATVTLLVGALLFVRTLLQLNRVELGFHPESVSTATVDPGDQGYGQAELVQYYREFVERLEASPGVTLAAVSTGAPFLCCGRTTRIRSADAPDDATPMEPLTYETTLGFFETLGVPLLRGRWFTADEVLPPEGRKDGVALVSAELARQLFGGGDPIGRYLELPVMGREDHRLRIVGVVGDVRWRDLDGPIEPIVFEPFGQSGRVDGDAYVLAKSATRGPAVAELRRIARELDASLPIVRPMGLTEAVRENLSARRMFANLLVLLATLAIALAAVGLYGVIAFAVAARTREFGIRMAMGADTPTILGLVLRRGVVLAALGIVTGLGGAYALARMIESRLFGVTALDPVSYVLAVVVLTAVALLATWIPARRATRVDPAVALRYE